MNKKSSYIKVIITASIATIPFGVFIGYIWSGFVLSRKHEKIYMESLEEEIKESIKSGKIDEIPEKYRNIQIKNEKE
jgi:adenine/guanine phosphoribosyltransferase-like PRPP-binding protein